MREEGPGEWWYSKYESILSVFGFDRKRDELAAESCGELMLSRPCVVGDVRSLIEGRTVVLAGGSDVLEEDLRALSGTRGRFGLVLVAADGATRPILEKGLVPDVVVTDLDGGIDSLMSARERGAFLIVHAHGDNLVEVTEFLKRVDGRIEATCQCRPTGHVHNFGGFTDGDRAAFLVLSFQPSALVLIGMDLDGPVGRLTKPDGWYTPERERIKRLKLRVASDLFLTASEIYGGKVRLIDASSSSSTVPGFIKRPLRSVFE
ncbi:MAG: DUF115 domain-containing protein [Aigarchaeota archaeon]|nr:DUF115 domain-containing protein [Aigarchaeota archaeon]MDW8093153.1 DUF115 domain-containing protein [Nitrososphaerota archaeon]